MAQVNEALGRMRDIHERYTIEAITERLARDGYTDLKEAVRAEVDKQIAEYKQLDTDYGTTGLYNIAMTHLEGMEHIQHITAQVGEALDGQHRHSTTL